MNNDIVICKSDKGNAIVILNKIDYITKMKFILNNRLFSWTNKCLVKEKEYTNLVYQWDQLFSFKILSKQPSSSYVKDSFNFVKMILKIKPDKKFKMCSFDVESLYTNLPVNEAIEMALDLMYKPTKLRIFLLIVKQRRSYSKLQLARGHSDF